MSSERIFDLTELSSKWPSLGQGNHSELVRFHHDLLKSIVGEVVSLKQEVFELKRVNEILSLELKQYKKSPAPTASTPVSFAAIIAGQSSESKKEQHELLNLIATENKDRHEREQNIIISGLPESSHTSESDLVKKSFEEVSLCSQSSNSSRLTALKIKNVRRLKTSKNPSNKPNLVVVSFSSTAERDLAIKSCNRHKAANFTNVFVREDRTPAQQAAFVKQREEIRYLNEELDSLKLLDRYRNVVHKSRNSIVCIDLEKSAAAKNYVIIQHKTVIESAKKSQSE